MNIEEKINGRIQKALSGFYDVDTGAETISCRARGRFRKDGLTPLVGDRVAVRILRGNTGYVEEILPRKNAFSRPAAANVDQMVIVASAAVPKTDPFLIDRMAAVAVLKGCEVLLLVNKCDLDRGEELCRLYRASGIPTLLVSARTGEGMEALKQALAGKLSVFTGNTGVGKSSILNALDPSFDLPTGEISAALGRGRHTTRHVEIHTLALKTEIIDTPGFSSFDAEELNWELKEHLPETFPEFAPFLSQCRFVGCGHTKEAGCAVLEALRAGKIQPSRHASYLRLYEALKPLKQWRQKGP